MRTDESELEQVIVMARVVDPVDRKGGMRLNAAMKNEVVEKAMKHGFDKRKAALVKEELRLSHVFHNKAFGPTVLKHARALEGTPFVQIGIDRYGRKLVSETRVCARWNVGGQTVDLQVDGTLPQHLGFTQSKNPYTITDVALVERCRAWQSDSEAYNKDFIKVSATLKGMLERITTYPSLEKNWPQGVLFYKHLPKAYPFRHQVPAVMIDELNAALGV